MSLSKEPRDDCVAEAAAEHRIVSCSEEFHTPSARCKLAKESPTLSAIVSGSPPKSTLLLARATESVDSLLEEFGYYSLDYDKGEDECGCKREAKREMRDSVACALSHSCFAAKDSLLSPPIEEMSSNKVFVFNIEYSTTKAQLFELFSRCGAVASISLPFDKVSSRIKGYAFITFDRAESVQRAIFGMNRFYLNGRPLGVRLKIGSKSSSARSKRWQNTKSATGSAFKFPSAGVAPISAAAGRSPLPLESSRRTPKPAVGDGLTLFVGNIPLKITRVQIWHLFADACGNQVDAVRIVTTKSGKSRGFGYVDFYTKADATRALALNGRVLCGRPLRVDRAEGYQPDYCKKKALRTAAPLNPLDALNTATALQSPFVATDALRTAAYVSPIGEGYLPVLRVPRGYVLALVPMVATVPPPMAAVREVMHASQPHFGSLQSETCHSFAWRVPNMVPLTDADAGRRPPSQVSDSLKMFHEAF